MAQSGASVSYDYVAPIALTEDLVEGTTVSGTINGVKVSGTVKSRRVELYVIAQASLYKSSGNSPVAAIGYDVDNYKIALRKQPESDLTIHLTQAIPAHKVPIPEEYLELTETNEVIAAAQTTANAAQTTANAAQDIASRALDGLASTEIVRSIYFDATSGAFMTKQKGKNYTYGPNSSNPFPKIAVCKQNSIYWGDNAPEGQTLIIAFLSTGEANSRWNVSGVALDMMTGVCYRIDTNYIAFDQSSGFSVTFKEMTYGGIIIKSSTSGSTKKFRITVDDTGTIKATEVTNN